MVQLLAQIRQRGEAEDIGLAARRVDEKLAAEIDWLGALDHADELMLAGHYRAAMRSYRKGILLHPLGVKGYLKLLRLSVFVVMPPIRSRLFVR